VILAFVLLAALHAPEECLGTGFSTEWQGKTYTFRFEDWRDEFLRSRALLPALRRAARDAGGTVGMTF
jgi:hypothetical protein